MTSTNGLAGIVLAAGQGTRLKSAHPKVLHQLGGRALVSYAVEAMAAATGATPLLVVGPEAAAVRAAWASGRSMVQPQPRGTADAVRQARSHLLGLADTVLVSYADMPLLRPDTLRALVAGQAANPGALTLLSLRSPRRADFGRVVRNGAGQVQAVVEAAQATPAQLALIEVNVGGLLRRAECLLAVAGARATAGFAQG